MPWQAASTCSATHGGLPPFTCRAARMSGVRSGAEWTMNHGSTAMQWPPTPGPGARAGHMAPAADEHPRQALRRCPRATHVRRVIAPVQRRHRDDERVGPLRGRRPVRRMPAASTV